MDAEKQSIRSKHRKELLLQIAFGFIANMANISSGMNLGFSAIALPTLTDKNATYHIDDAEASWVASIASISTPIGCLLTGFFLDRFGRKVTLLILNIPSLLGWLLIAFATGSSTLNMIYAGRFFTGLATGMGSAPATVYSAEMAKDSLRGVLVTWTSIAISLGIFLVYVLGYAFQDNWKLVAGLSAIFPACALILTFFFLPETPSWLLSKGKKEEAEKSLKRIRGVPKKEEMPLSVQNELQDLHLKFPDKIISKSDQSFSSRRKEIWKMFTKAGVIKPFIIMNCFFFFQQFSGIFVVIMYAVDVVKEAGINWDPYLIAILIGLTRVVVTIIMSIVSKRYGRRPPSIVSGAGMTICMAALATFLYLQSAGKISDESARNLSWIPVTSLILYILTSTIGFLTLPWAMIGEVFPSEVRGVAAGLTTCFAYVFNFIIVKVYPDMLNTLTKYGVFFFYGAFSLVGTAFVVLFLPETEGKSLQEIEEYFNRKKTKSKKGDRKDQNLELINGKDVTVAITPTK